MKISYKNATLTLPETLEDFDFYKNKGFIVYEKHDILDEKTIEQLSVELYEIKKFNKKYEGLGGKSKFSINGGNIKEIESKALLAVCRIFLDKKFFRWFKKTHLIYFQSGIPVYIENPQSYLTRFLILISKNLKLPLSYYYTEIEYSSINLGEYIPPHTDSNKKRLSFVFYVWPKNKNYEENEKIALGTIFWKPREGALSPLKRFNCQLLRCDEEKKFYKDHDVMHISKYENNKIAGFVKNDSSWHSVAVNKIGDRRALVINVWEK